MKYLILMLMLLTPQPLYSSNLIAQYCAAFLNAPSPNPAIKDRLLPEHRALWDIILILGPCVQRPVVYLHTCKNTYFLTFLKYFPTFRNKIRSITTILYQIIDLEITYLSIGHKAYLGVLHYENRFTKIMSFGIN